MTLLRAFHFGYRAEPIVDHPLGRETCVREDESVEGETEEGKGGHMNKYWLVWNEQMGFPTHKHPTYESAKAEAERLARNHTGHTFQLLELVGSCKRSDIVWTVPDGDEPIPF